MTDLKSTICVEPLSSPYGVLIRAHTYLLAATLIAPLPPGWLFRAALAAFCTRTAVAAIDAAVILRAVAPGRPIVLDAIVLVDLLGLATIIACWLLIVSRRAAESAARPLMRAWAVAVVVGLVMAFVALARLGRLAVEPDAALIEADCLGGVQMEKMNLVGPPINVPVQGLIGSKFAWVENRVGIAPLVCSVLALAGAAMPKRRPSKAAGLNYNVEEATAEIVAVGSRARHRPGAFRAVARAVLMVGFPAMALLSIVSAEQYLLAMVQDLPSVESMTSAGQWGVWAATGVVLFATFVNAVKEKMEIGKGSQKPQDEIVSL